MPPIDLLKLIDDSKRLRPLTKLAYSNVVRQWLKFAGDDPNSWTAATAQAFYDHLIAADISVRTANVMIAGGLAFVFKRAAALYGINNPIAAVDRYPTPAREPRRALRAPAARALLQSCNSSALSDLRDRALLHLGLYTGMRRMSLVNVDLDGVIDHGDFVTLHTILKGGAEFDVPLDKRVWASTEPYRKALIKARGTKAGPLFTRLRPQLDGAALDSFRVEGRLTEDGLLKAFNKRAETANVKDFSPHILRHTFVTWCRGEPAYIETQFVAAVTGHAENITVPGLVHYTDKKALAGDAARRCYEAITAKLMEGP